VGGGKANRRAGIAEVSTGIVTAEGGANGSFNSSDGCDAVDDMGVNPRSAASAGTTGVDAVAAEGGPDVCTNDNGGGRSGGGSVGAMAATGGSGGGRSNRNVRSWQRLHARQSDSRRDLYLVDEVLLLVGDRLQGSGDRGQLFYHGAQHIVLLLRGGGRGIENRREKGGIPASATVVALNTQLLWLWIGVDRFEGLGKIGRSSAAGSGNICLSPLLYTYSRLHMQ
jgi:hypothetical protein